jgi:alpha-beta hydrolase superfamily lysophospholipase
MSVSDLYGSNCQYPVSDGTTLHGRHFAPAGVPRAFLLVLNGIQSHAGWYECSAAALAHAGFDVRLCDRRGSGQSAGLRGHAAHWRRLVNDVVSLLQDVRFRRDRMAPAAPVILMAVSWGAKLAATVADLRPELLDGLVLLYPGIYSHFRPGIVQRALLRLAEALGARRRLAPVPLDDPRLFTSSRKWQEFIAHDPLALHQVTTGFLFADRTLTRIARSAAPRLQSPTLLLLAGRDHITDNPATRVWFDRLAARDKRLIEYPQAAHTLEFEDCCEDYIRDLIDWLGHVSIRTPS